MARDNVLTSYVSYRIGELLAAGATSKQLAADAGFRSASFISQVKSGRLGVGGGTAPKYARMLHMASVSELHAAAERWYSQHGAPAAQLLVEAKDEVAWPERAEAILVVKTWTGATDAELARIVAAFGADLFRSRDKDWWVETLAREVKEERARAAQSLAKERLARETAAAAERTARSHWRLASGLKKDVGRLQEEKSQAQAQAGTAEAHHPPKRRRRGVA